MADEHYHLGVLLVHGIGSQKRGDTLLQFGEPLGDSVERWLDKDAIDVRGTMLLETDGDTPAHTSVTVRYGPDEKRLLVAESCWADTFPVPGWWSFATWLLWCLPFVVFRVTDHRLSLITTHNKIDECRERGWTPWNTLRWVFNQAMRIVKNLLSVALTFVATVLVALAGIVAVVPRFRAFFLSTQLLLIRYIGDSYALLRSPGRRDAMVSKVEHDLAWVESDACAVAIVAHSQGAEVVRRVLARREQGRPIASLVTLGSGIAKLSAVDQLGAPGARGAAFAAYILRIAAGGLTVVSTLAALGLMPLWLIVGFPVSGVLIHSTRWELRKIVKDEVLVGGLRQVLGKTDRWLDLYATSDPVPEDGLPLREAGFAKGWSREIANRRSPLLDHTSYWQNVEAFHSAVIRELAGVLGVTAWQIPRSVVAKAQAHRWKQTYWLLAGRLTVALAVLAAVVLPRLGPGREAWDDTANWLGGAAPIFGWIHEDAETWLGDGFGRNVLVVSLVLIAGVAVYGLLSSLWQRAAAKRGRTLFGKAEPAATDRPPAEPTPPVVRTA